LRNLTYRIRKNRKGHYALINLDCPPTAVHELERALRLAQGSGVGVLVMAFGDPAVRIRMFLCHALAEAGCRDEAIAVADEMVLQAHLSGPADESDALASIP